MKYNLIRMRRMLSLVLLCVASVAAKGQQKHAAQLLLDLKKMNVLGSVMYVAAHPDDENTRLITWLANDRLYRTAYLSLTRGDGGQNLIGPEKGPKGVGIIRTQELLEARKIDGGEQYFTRAVDFGYSKSADETLRFWDKKKVLADVVWNIRRFRPDVIITRFPPTNRAGHGHHSVSAMLAEEAFRLAADSEAFPEQLEFVSAWQAKRLFHNSSTWWDKSLPEKAKEQPQKFITCNVGTYNALLGESHNEIASRSRSAHRSQGFGARLARGEQFDYLEMKLGSPFQGDFMDGVDQTWTREGMQEISVKLRKAIAEFNTENPAGSVPLLTEIYAVLEKAPASAWVDYKKRKLKTLIKDCLGIHMVVKAAERIAVRGEPMKAQLELIQRSGAPVAVQSVSIGEKITIINEQLSVNSAFSTDLVLETGRVSTQPYWLENPYGKLFDVSSQELIGLAEKKNPFSVSVNLKAGEAELSYGLPVVYQWVNPAMGELNDPVVVSEGASLSLDRKVYLFNKEKETVRVTLDAHQQGLEGRLSLRLPKGWNSEPNDYMVGSVGKGETKTYAFEVSPPAGEASASVRAVLRNGKKIEDRLVTIDYPHISRQDFFEKAAARVVHIPLRNQVRKVGFIVGAGDEIPSSLRAIGIQVDEIDPKQMNVDGLLQYPAVVVGIRAYNTKEALGARNRVLMDYVKRGGNLVVQYSTSHRLQTEQIGPYPIKLSRGRVTDENAAATILKPRHALFRYPNRIAKRDFEGWVQERGLYFAGEWSDDYTSLLSWHDEGEKPQEGGLLVCEYGKGTFVYTGVSFFRQLPAGVSGAYKLFVNLLNYSQKSPSQ
ncbi:MAG: PIG-L family deacetylase [Cytophagales bacterium]|nr:PIG-L family deacetylase [Cytophagales bacterium]